MATTLALGRRARATDAPTRDAPLRSLPDFAALVERVGDAVVNVSVVGRATRTAQNTPPGLSPDDPLFDFFRRFGIPPPGAAPRGEAPLLRGEGSGFIVSPDGYVLTNAHVVAEASEVTVRLTDRREFSAKVIGTDPRTDVAVLKIEGRDLPAVTLGDPARLRPGEWVVAIGSPFGFENSVTVGVVSATSRALGPDQSLVPFIQTDVAVNPGNSGGPLFNLRGEVTGINSQIYSRTGGYQGISFAIPIDVARNVQQQLVSTGRVVRGRIGLAVQEVDAQLARSFGLDRPRGALVSSVEPDGPAARAGLEPGDVILAVDGEPVATSGQLPSRIARQRPGTEVRLAVWRDGRERNITVRVAELDPGSATAARGADGRGDGAGPAPGPGAAESPRLGLVVRALTGEGRARLGIREGGLAIERAEGPAAEAGLQRGDVLLAANNRRLVNPEQLREVAQRASGVLALLVQRGEARLYIAVPLAAARGDSDGMVQ